MTAAAFRFAETEMHALPSGALFIPTLSTLVVADLHLEKGAAFARRGATLPPYDSRATLDRLAGVIGQTGPARVVCLGDSFHDRDGPGRMAPADRKALQDLTAGPEGVWVAGNHDPAPAESLGGTVVTEVRLDGLVLRHEAVVGFSMPEVSGHFHPKASVTANGRRVSGRCFVADGRRLILPAFGAYAGGLDVFDPALSALLAPAFQVHLIGRRRVHTVTSAALNRP